MLSKNADDLAKRYLIEELGIPADMVKDAGQNLIGFFAKLHAIQQRLETETQPTA